MPLVVSAGGAITLDSGSTIDGVTGHQVTAGSLDLAAVNDVTLSTNVAQIIAAITGVGNLTLNEADAVTLANLSVANGDVVVSWAAPTSGGMD